MDRPHDNSDPIYPDAPGFKGSAETSREAAEAMAPKCGPLQKLVLAAVTDAGPVGLTSDEVAATLGMDRGSTQPRTSELRRRGLIGDSLQRRRNVTGKRAVVWVAACHLPKQEGGADAA